MPQYLSLTCAAIMDGKKPRDLRIDLRLDDPNNPPVGLAQVSNWIPTVHEVAVERWEQDEDGLRAELALLVVPDPYIPKHGLRPRWTFTIELTGRSGSYRAHMPGMDPVTTAGQASLTVAEPSGNLDGWWRGNVIPARPDDDRDHPHYTLEILIAENTVKRAAIGKSFCKQASRFLPLTVDTAELDGPGLQLKLHGSAYALLDDPIDLDPISIHGTAVLLGDRLAGSLRLDDQQAGWSAEREPLLDPTAAPAIWRQDDPDKPWFASVRDHRPVASGEHPRLLLRRADLPALRAKAATPSGQAILARLRHIMGQDGEAMPTVFNRYETVGVGARGPKELGLGTYTAWHATGFATLYLATGEQNYADLARQALEILWTGQPDIDERYAWTKVGGLRIGPVLEAAALAYDCCYEAWDESFRAEVRRRFLAYDDVGTDTRWTMEKLLEANNFPPGSNHYGAYIGGPGLVALALRGDPGVDDERIDRWLRAAHLGIIRNLRYGFGDGGGFAEGHHPSRLSANSGFMGLLQAMRVAHGRDYLQPRPNATAITTRWIQLIKIVDDEPGFPHHGVYGGDAYDTWGLSHGGEFATGFGCLPAALHPALLWTWRHCIEGRQHQTERAAWLEAGEDSYDVMFYPHRALYALVNWPVDVEPENPAKVMPRIMVDRVHGFLCARDRWQDGHDSIVTMAFCRGPKGYYPFSKGTPNIRIWSRGLQTAFPFDTAMAEVIAYDGQEDGSLRVSCRSAEGPHHFLLDLSGVSGADLVLIGSGSLIPEDPVIDGAEDGQTDGFWFRHRLEGQAIAVLVIGSTKPDLHAVAAEISIGRRSYRLDQEGWRVVQAS